MKNFSMIKKMVLVCLVSFAGFSCDDDDEGTLPSQNKITSIAANTPDLSILVSALDRANLISVLDGDGPFTVLAPTNAAFVQFLADNNYASLDDVPDAVLTQVLLNHVVAGSFQSSDLSTGYVTTQATSAASNTNMSLYVNTSAVVSFNDVSSVTTPNIMASNGVIHIVDAVIGLPTVVTFALADPNFSSLVAALTRDDQPDFAGILSGNGPFTVFAPNNNAFGNLVAELDGVNGLGDIPTATLTAVLQYHVVSGNVRSSAIMDGMDVPTLNASNNFTINTTNGVVITDASGRTSNIVSPLDIQASNGVIHTIETVLLPN